MPTVAPPAHPAPDLTRWVPALDGVRGIAVGAVILYHFAPDLLPGGFLGVDVFFVVSGFLIARLVSAEIQRTGTIALHDFWARRIRRLLPALALMAVAVVGASAVWLSLAERSPLRQQVVGVLLYAGNWALLRGHTDYFATVGRPSPFLHTWSLAIEEQFYLGFPLVAYAFRNTVRDRPLRIASGALAAAVGSTLWMAHLVGGNGDTTRAYLGTDSHSMGLLVGVAAGVVAGSPAGHAIADRVRARVGTASSELLGAALLAAVALPMWWCSGSSHTLYRGGFLAYSMACVGLVAVCVMYPARVVVRVLRSRLLVEIGLRSYSLYLWHWPVRVFVEASSGLDGVRLFVVRVALTAVLSEASFRLVERPFRSGALAARWRTRGAAAAYAMFGAVSILVAVLFLQGSVAQPTDLSAALARLNSGPDSPSTAPARTAPGARPAPPKPDLRVNIFGDSTAYVFGYHGALHKSQLHVAIDGDARLGCGLTPGAPIGDGRVLPLAADCAGWQQRWTLEATARPTTTHLLMTGAWDVLDHQINGHVVRFGTAAWTELLTQSYRQALQALTVNGATVHVFEVPCYGTGDANDPIPERSDPVRIAAVNAVITELAHELPRVSVVPWRELVCPNGHRAESIGGVRLWEPDDSHLSDGGALLVWQWLLPKLGGN